VGEVNKKPGELPHRKGCELRERKIIWGQRGEKEVWTLFGRKIRGHRVARMRLVIASRGGGVGVIRGGGGEKQRAR